MCLFISHNTEVSEQRYVPERVEEDLEVFKVLAHGVKGIETPFFLMNIDFDENGECRLEKYSVVEFMDDISYRYDFTGAVMCGIKNGNGYHSYTNKNIALLKNRELNFKSYLYEYRDFDVFSAVIPKGSLVYRNEHGTEICSNNLIIKNKVISGYES